MAPDDEKVEKSKSFENIEIEEIGLNYINRHKNYLLFSALFPILLIIIQILNFLFILILEIKKPPEIVRRPIPLDFISTFIILLMIAGIAFLNFLHLFKWRKNVQIYKIQTEKINHHFEKKRSKGEKIKPISLTKLFYEVISSMKILRRIFVILNFLVAYYFLWFLSFFILRPPFPHPRPPLHKMIELLNFISQLFLILYLIFQWRHYIRWTRKFRSLEKFEKKIFSELFED